MYLYIKKADYQSVDPTRYFKSLNISEISKIRCYLNSLLRDVTDNSSQVYSDRYIGFRVRASKYFLRGLHFILRHVRTSSKTSSHDKTPSASTFAIFSVLLIFQA